MKNNKVLRLLPRVLSFLIVSVISCTKDPGNSSAISVAAINCTEASYSGTPESGNTFTGNVILSYTGGNGGVYGEGPAVGSTGVTGLSITLQPGTLSTDEGNINYSITGTPASAGIAYFAVNFGGQSCTLSLNVNPSTPSCTNTAVIENVIAKINTFKSLLSASQLNEVQLAYTKQNATRWEDEPCGGPGSCRNGLQFATLSAPQVTAALDIITAAMGTTVNEGSDEWKQIRAADDVLQGGGGGMGYGSGIYSIAFLGMPDISGTWQLQFGGHHSAGNITYEGNIVAGATPMFEGIEPKSWTSGSITYAPLSGEQTSMAAMLASLNSAQLTSAKIPGICSDIMLGDEHDGQFPLTKAGIPVNSLTPSQKALVMAAIEHWVQDVDDVTATCLTNIYQDELDQTYIAYCGNETLTGNGDYVRIDGPGVWIEFICLNGSVFSGPTHYHSVWRDHNRDYGNNFTF